MFNDRDFFSLRIPTSRCRIIASGHILHMPHILSMLRVGHIAIQDRMTISPRITPMIIQTGRAAGGASSDEMKLRQ